MPASVTLKIRTYCTLYSTRRLPDALVGGSPATPYQEKHRQDHRSRRRGNKYYVGISTKTKRPQPCGVDGLFDAVHDGTGTKREAREIVVDLVEPAGRLSPLFRDPKQRAV